MSVDGVVFDLDGVLIASERVWDGVRERLTRESGGRWFDGAQEAKLVALACSRPPAGRKRWTLRLLADRLVELQVVDTISGECVRTTLKKTS